MALSPTKRRTLIAILVLGLVGLVLVARTAFFIEPNELVVKTYQLDLPAWPRALDGFKIVAVGDIHAGAPFIDEAKLNDIVARITAAKPDLIVWLGDYVIQGVVGGTFMEPEKIARTLAKATATHGQIAIIGNHDRWLDTSRVEKAFEAAGIPFLRWRSKVFALNGVKLHVYGLDDFELSPGYWPTYGRAEREWRTLPSGDPLIVLSHSPDIFPSIPSRISLTLAAHTHGGQVRLPLIGSPIVPSSYGQRYALGHIVEDGRHLFVNPGIGTSIIPVRFGVPPEISVLTLHSIASH
ncbi:MAG: metallophosphoesterase [Vicinamibacteria bacterium]